MDSGPDRSRNRPTRWLRQRRDHRALRPLWNFLLPVIAARHTVTVMRAEANDRFERRLMEIRDALRVLDGYRLEPPAAVTHAGDDAAREAAILAISLQLWYDHTPSAPPRHTVAPQRTSTTSTDSETWPPKSHSCHPRWANHASNQPTPLQPATMQ
ncbi:DUF6545 domain-containing protein [Saccharomonospora sp. CUA-673]|uniref:DUF6545 domain-containing protein n=1 Tax=Saccharomonospora sp. CUA-673 TaxID=1904969 RepID=UPI0035141824